MEAETRKPGGASRRRAAKPSARSHGFTVLEDISGITARSEDLQETLQRIVEVVAERMGTEVCSLYILDPRVQRLTLWATQGLDRSTIGKVTMSVEEGLTGMAIEKLEPVMAVDAITHPRYKYFPETGEEKYHSFVGVPVIERGTPIGVLVVQTLRRRKFTRHELRLLKAIATQVGGIIAQARLLEDLKSKEKERREYRRRMVAAIKRLQAYETSTHKPEAAARGRGRSARLQGLPAAPGFGRGRAHLLQPPVSFALVEDTPAADGDEERRRVRRALAESVTELESLKARLSTRMPEFDVKIIDAHRMMLEDKALLAKIDAAIAGGLAAEAALKRVVNEYLGQFSRMSDGYLRDRAMDLKDVGLRVLRNLLGVEEPERPLAEDSVLVAEELTLSDLSLIEHDRLRGIVLATGGVTSHASILAKSFEIPTVVGVDGLTETVHEHDVLIVDGNSGVTYVNPPVDVTREYDRLDREYRAFNRGLESECQLPAETTDGRRVSVYANIGLIADLMFAHRHGAEGVGLYRTEFPFLTYREFPDEEEQYQLYSRVVRGMEGRPVTIRTLDVGADKYPGYMRLPREDNPFLGWRSIRISLEMPEFFKVQLRAILRAATAGRVRLLFPMISSVEEIRRVKELLEETKEDLRKEGQDFDPAVPIGMMVEVPSAVALATQLIREVDFFSIGTNDLIQYLLAVDRNNNKVAPLYEPLHPAVLLAVHQAVQAAKGAGKWVGMCGEMAADPMCTLVLLGLGLDDLSMGPFFIPVIKRMIRSIPYGVARTIARDVTQMATVKEVKGYLFDGMKSLGIIELMEMYH
jgi:phosphotransferase system enzyme I (PtsP)